uniref:Uncharacterized protein n=1 Tax=Neovison vison TaxID=452646 RepID=A0A8C7BJ63_NEOVI
MPTNVDNLEEMDKLLEKYSLPKLNQEEIENLNTAITSNEIESVIKKPTKQIKTQNKKTNFQQMKVQDQKASQVNFIKHLKKD